MRQILVPAVCTALVSIGPALAEEIDHRRGVALLQSRRRGILSLQEYRPPILELPSE